MTSIIQTSALEVAKICRQRQVRRLSLFGSAARDDFRPDASDLDFLVEFHTPSPPDHANCYFGLQEDLEQLFGRPVDLVEPGPIRNPYFRQAVQLTQVLLYAAP